MSFCWVILLMLGCYASEWRGFKSFLRIVGVDSKYFPDYYKKTPNWMRKKHGIMQRWIPRYMYYYGHCIIIGPFIVSICSLGFTLTNKPSIYHEVIVAIYLIIMFFQGLFIIIMTRIYVGKWRNFRN